MRTALTLLLLLAPAAAADSKKLCARDVKFALGELDKRCGHFFKLKGISWPKVRREINKQVKGVRSKQDHYVVLCRLVARLRDGHAYVHIHEGGKGVQWPGPVLQRGPGVFLCRSGKRILVKNSFSKAAASGIKPGMEVVQIDGVPAAKWLDRCIAELRDFSSFSTDQQALFFACHWGLGGPKGSRLTLELRTLDKKSKRITLSRTASVVPVGPAMFPEGLKTIGRQSYGTTRGGYGYIHLRDVPRDLPAQLDAMLAALGNPPGLILDCRANGGGGCDHDAVYGRFLPPGKSIKVPKKTYVSGGPNPYGGPVVVVVDAGIRSAGETVAGIFKEDGRAYMIGESNTAGMSSQKATIELPSKLFALYVSVYSNKGRFNRGKGVEGIGIVPHEIMEYEQKDLAAGVDTLIRRAEKILGAFPNNKVLYRPKSFGWKPGS